MKIEEITMKTPIGKIMDCLRAAEKKEREHEREVTSLRAELQVVRDSNPHTKIRRLVEQIEAHIGAIDSEESLELHNLRMAAHDVRKEIGC